MSEVKWEVKGYVVPYDLPSENLVMFNNTEEGEKIKNYVRSKRVQATYYLHSLGVPATNSVIIVPLSKISKIDEVIAKVNQIYNSVNEVLKKHNLPEIGKPIVKKIPIVETQLVSFKDLAERQLKQKLDDKIDHLAELIQKIKEGVEEAKAKKIKSDLKALRKEMSDLEQIASELGIETDNQFALIGSLINQAISILEGQ